MQGTNQGVQMQDSRCFYTNPAHQLSHVRDIPASFSALRGYNICLRRWPNIKPAFFKLLCLLGGR